MTPFNPNPYGKRQNAATDQLIRGLFCALLGLGILVAPHFMGAGGIRDMLAGSWLVGWFALGLGVVFTLRYLKQRSRGKPGKH